jgi:hypothetical protein
MFIWIWWRDTDDFLYLVDQTIHEPVFFGPVPGVLLRFPCCMNAAIDVNTTKDLHSGLLEAFLLFRVLILSRSMKKALF